MSWKCELFPFYSLNSLVFVVQWIGFFKTYKLYFSLLGDEDGMYEDADEPAEEGEHENGSTPMEESWNIFCWIYKIALLNFSQYIYEKLSNMNKMFKIH